VRFLKSVLTLGACLSQPKEFKDFFVLLVEKVRVILCDRMDLRAKEVSGLFNVIIACFDPLPLPQEVKADASNYWALFVSTLSRCLKLTHLPA